MKYVIAHRRAVAAYRERHMALGLCLRCPLAATRGRHCDDHAAKRIVQQKVKRHHRATDGLCVRCGRPAVAWNYCPKHVIFFAMLRAVRAGRVCGWKTRVDRCPICKRIGHRQGAVCQWLTPKQRDLIEKWSLATMTPETRQRAIEQNARRDGTCRQR